MNAYIPISLYSCLFFPLLFLCRHLFSLVQKNPIAPALSAPLRALHSKTQLHIAFLHSLQQII